MLWGKHGGEGEFQVVNPTSSPITKVGVDYTVYNRTMRAWFDTIERMSHMAIPIFYSGRDNSLPVYVTVTYTTEAGQELSVSYELNYQVDMEEKGNVSSEPNTSELDIEIGPEVGSNLEDTAKTSRKEIFLPLLGIFVLLFLISSLVLLAKIRKKL